MTRADPCVGRRTGIVRDVEGVRHLAELGVVFLLFNIGLELSLERLRSLQRFVFGLGGLQVPFTSHHRYHIQSRYRIALHSIVIVNIHCM